LKKNHMEKFKRIKQGDVLGICAPSARFNTEKFNKGIQVLKNLGFTVKIPNEIFMKKRYLAGEDLLRADMINRIYSDSDIDAIICARGGYGALRVLELLDWNVINQNPKPFIGYSDSTAILLSIMANSNNIAIHGPNVVSLADAGKETIESFYLTLTGALTKLIINPMQIIQPGTCSGTLKGGNLSTIAHLLGTRFQPDFHGAVLFIEDVGEPAYKIDRMLTQMKMAGLFEGVKGVIIGTFEKCENQLYIDEILFEVFEDYNVPVLSGLAAGHGKINLSLWMGTPITMDTASGTIVWT